MQRPQLSQWQQTFVEQYLHDRPALALMNGGYENDRIYAALHAWDRLRQDHHFETLIIITDTDKFTWHQWFFTVEEFHNQLAVQSKNVLIRAILDIDDKIDQQIDTLYKAGKTFLILDQPDMSNIEAGWKQLNYLRLTPADGSQLLFLLRLDPIISRHLNIKQYLFDPTILKQNIVQTEISRFSPSYDLLQKGISQGFLFDNLSWRNFEKLIRDLLESDGYAVELMNGTKDGGIDVIAIKKDPVSGFYQTVWQTKKYNKMKVGLHLIRELADSVRELKASKGIIVTTSFLTKGALDRVERDKYTLGKVDRDDLKAWIDRTLYK